MYQQQKRVRPKRDYASRQAGQREAARQRQAHKEYILSRVVTRDPCAYCGTRADLHGSRCS